MRHLSILLGQINPLDLGRNFRAAEQQFQWSNAVLAMIVIAAIVAAIGLGIRYATDGERRGYRSPRRLFNELCRAHRLDRPSRVLLARLASCHRVTPSVLFLKPECFDVTQLGSEWTGDRATLEQLRDTIFGRKLDSAQTV